MRDLPTPAKILGVLVVVAGLIVGLALFQPWKLFVDDVVDEAEPTVPPEEMLDPVVMAEDMPDDMPDDTAGEPAIPSGSFIDRAHSTTGIAKILTLNDGARVLRIEDLDTDNGPDLFVYLTTAGPDAPRAAFEEDGEFVNLGKLKGNIGNQNYDIPAEVDLGKFSTVVIWCRRFSVAFGAAQLS